MPDQNCPLVEIHSLGKRFGEFQALDNINLSIDRGEVFGLLGPNGAGKSTLIRTLLGFLNPTMGHATIEGFDCQRQRMEVHRNISYLPGDARLPRLMKARSVLSLYCEFRESADVARGLAIAKRFDLDLEQWVGLMSTGMRQKLALAIALAADVPLLVLDEPTANLDPTVRGQVLEVIEEAKQRNTAVLFSSHVLSEIEDSCDRVGILRAGKLVHVESVRELKRQHRILARLREDRMPELPQVLQSEVTLKRDRDRIQIETAGDLSLVLRWLADAPLEDMVVQPVGLRAVYDRFHFPTSIVTSTEATS